MAVTRIFKVEMLDFLCDLKASISHEYMPSSNDILG